MMRGLRLYCSAKVTIPDHRKSPLDQLRGEHHIVTGIEQYAGTRVGEVRRVQTRAQLRLPMAADGSSSSEQTMARLRLLPSCIGARPIDDRNCHGPMHRQAAQVSIPNSRLISAKVKVRPALRSASPSSIARIASSVNSSSSPLVRRRAGGSSLGGVRVDGTLSSLGILRSPQQSQLHDDNCLLGRNLLSHSLRGTQTGRGTHWRGSLRRQDLGAASACESPPATDFPQQTERRRHCLSRSLAW